MTFGRPPRLAVALPTRNRRTQALAALASLSPQLEPGDELLVVDNGSSDGTGEAVRRWLAEHEHEARLLTVPERSLSLARNAALREAATPIVCFVDDDERPAPGWLSALRRAWARAEGRVAAVGGPKRIVWGAPRPAWLPDHLLYVINGAERGGGRRRLDLAPGRGYLSGGNMSVRVDATLGVGGFEPDRAYLAAARETSRRRRAPLSTARSGEEQDLQRRLAASGWEIWYEPDAAVDHLVPPERLTTAFFGDFFRQRGLLEARRGRPRLAALAILARSAARYALLRAARRPDALTSRFTWTYGWTVLTGPRGDAAEAAGEVGEP